MEFFRIRRDIPFMRHALVLNAISAITFLAAVFFLVTKGLHLSVEFTGGTVMEISYQQTAPLNTIRTDLTKLGYQDVQVQNFGSSKDVLFAYHFKEMLRAKLFLLRNKVIKYSIHSEHQALTLL